jgi:hypothetical protein
MHEIETLLLLSTIPEHYLECPGSRERESGPGLGYIPPPRAEMGHYVLPKFRPKIREPRLKELMELAGSSLDQAQQRLNMA